MSDDYSTVLKALQADIGSMNTRNGWRDRPAPEGGEVDRAVALLALVASEAFEAIEEVRNGWAVTTTYHVHAAECAADGPGGAGCSCTPKPEGVPSELADILIRVLDFADLYGIDVPGMVKEKLAYNATRGRRHGNKAV